MNFTARGGGVAEAVTVSAGSSPVNARVGRAQLPRQRQDDRRAAAERPQLHRPRAAAARRDGVSAPRRRLGRGTWSRHEHQRAGSALERLPARRHAPERLHERARGQRRQHGARRRDGPRVPRRDQRLRRRIRAQLRRAGQRAHQVGTQRLPRQRLRVPPQRRARRAELLRRRRTSPTSGATSSAATVGGPLRTDRLFFFGGYEGLREKLGRTVPTFVPDDNARQGYLPSPTDPSQLVFVGVHPAVQPYLDEFPAGERSVDSDGGIASTRSISISGSISTSLQGRVDYNAGSAHHLFARYTFDDADQHLPTDYPQFPRDVPVTKPVLHG